MKAEPDLVDIFEMSRLSFIRGFGVDCGHMVIPTIFEEEVLREKALARAQMLDAMKRKNRRKQTKTS